MARRNLYDKAVNRSASIPSLETPGSRDFGLGGEEYGEQQAAPGGMSNFGNYLSGWAGIYGPYDEEFPFSGWNVTDPVYQPPWGTNITDFNTYIQDNWADYSSGSGQLDSLFDDFFDYWSGSESNDPTYYDFVTYFNSLSDTGQMAPGYEMSPQGSGGGNVGGSGDIGFGNMFMPPSLVSCENGPVYHPVTQECIYCCP